MTIKKKQSDPMACDKSDDYKGDLKQFPVGTLIALKRKPNMIGIITGRDEEIVSKHLTAMFLDSPFLETPDRFSLNGDWVDEPFFVIAPSCKAAYWLITHCSITVKPEHIKTYCSKCKEFVSVGGAMFCPSCGSQLNDSEG